MSGHDSDLLLHDIFCGCDCILSQTIQKSRESTGKTSEHPLECSPEDYIKETGLSQPHNTQNHSDLPSFVSLMAATTSSISVHIPRYHCIISSSSSKPGSLPASQPSACAHKPEKPLPWAKSLSVASTVVASLVGSPLALAAKQIAESPQEDNRGLLLLAPVAAAVGWVLFNILGPALNQLNRMRNEKITIIGLGLGGLLTAASSPLFVPAASAASEVAEAEGASGGSNQGLLALIVAAAVGFEVVLLNVMQSAYEEK